MLMEHASRIGLQTRMPCRSMACGDTEKRRLVGRTKNGRLAGRPLANHWEDLVADVLEEPLSWEFPTGPRVQRLAIHNRADGRELEPLIAAVEVERDVVR